MGTTETLPDNQTGAQLDIASDVGTLILDALARQTEIDFQMSDVTLKVLGERTNNIAVHASSGHNGNYREVVCRTPKEPDALKAIRLCKEYGVLKSLPAGVGPKPYHLDMARSDRPVLVQEYIEGRTVPFDQWNQYTVLAFASSLGKVHSITPKPKRAVWLDAHLMRHPIGERLRVTPLDREARLLCRVVLANARSHLKKTQSLFDQAPYTLIHNDLDPNNVLVLESGDPKLIDFERADLSDPSLEIAEICNPDEAFSVDGDQACLALGPAQEAAFLKAYNEATNRDEDPTLVTRIRVGQLVRLARLVVGHTALITAGRAHHFGMTSDVVERERDRALELYLIAAASL